MATAAKPRPRVGDVRRAGAKEPAAKPRSAVMAEPAWVDLGVALVLIGGLVLRFVATSPMWLDEALSVNIASVPLGDMAGVLRRDGAPPLYYVLLKGWMELFGTSTVAVRAMSGVFAVGAMPLVWMTGRRVAKREGAWVATVLLASSPFALRYATEARMYSLVVLLTAIGVVLLNAFLDRPSTPRLAGLMAVSGALVLTHYWALFLVLALMLVLALRAERANKPYELNTVRFPSSWAMVGIAVGALAIVPWMPSFLYQVQHTGTPWAASLGPSTPVIALMSFGGTGNDASSLLGLFLVVLALVGVFGRRLDSRVDDKLLLLDLRGATPGRNIGLLVLTTLLIATTVGMITDGGFQPRYAAVVFVPFLILVALGASNIGALKLRRGIVAVVTGLGLLVGTAGAGQPRTQAGEIASILATRARPNDLIVYCPDQLGPAMDRALADLGLADELRQARYPDLARPKLVNWVDYSDRMKKSDPERIAQRIHQRGAGFTVWLVWTSSYRATHGRCGELNAHLNNVRPKWRNVTTASATGRAESANLTIYPPG